MPIWLTPDLVCRHGAHQPIGLQAASDLSSPGTSMHERALWLTFSFLVNNHQTNTKKDQSRKIHERSRYRTHGLTLDIMCRHRAYQPIGLQGGLRPQQPRHVHGWRRSPAGRHPSLQPGTSRGGSDQHLQLPVNTQPPASACLAYGCCPTAGT